MLPRGMREILSLKLPWVRSPLDQKQKRADLSVNPFVVIGGAEGDRTPDPKTASRERQKNTILDKSPGFPFITMNQGLVSFTMILSVTMIMPVWIIFSTILAQWIFIDSLQAFPSIKS